MVVQLPVGDGEYHDERERGWARAGAGKELSAPSAAANDDDIDGNAKMLGNRISHARLERRGRRETLSL